MKTFTKTLIALTAAAALAGCQTTGSTDSGKNWRVSSYTPMTGVKGIMIGADKDYNHGVIADPTGEATSATVERFALDNGDCKSKDCGRADGVYRERVEMTIHPYDTGYGMGNKVWYGIDVYIPSDFAGVFGKSTTSTIIGQVKQTSANPDGSYDEKSPTFYLEYKSGVVQAVVRPREGSKYDRKSTVAKLDEVAGRWVRWEWMIDFTTKDTGSVEVYMDNRKVMQYDGATVAYTNKTRSTLKYGMYTQLRDFSVDYYRKNPEAGLGYREIYIDNASIAKSREGLFPEQEREPVFPEYVPGKTIITNDNVVLGEKDPNWKPLSMGSIKAETYKDNIGKFDPSMFSPQVK